MSEHVMAFTVRRLALLVNQVRVETLRLKLEDTAQHDLLLDMLREIQSIVDDLEDEHG